METALIPEMYQPHAVIGVILIVFAVVYFEWLPPTIGFLLGVMALILTGTIAPAKILTGFSNQAIASVVLLILITAGVRDNFNVTALLDRLFGKITSYRWFMASMLSKVALLSSFVNNTPVVVLMTPYVFEWAKKRNISPSKLLIPLSYATITGGMITLIGTSTTLVLNGFLIDQDLHELNSVHLLLTGLAVTVSCVLFLILLSDRILPDRMDVLKKFQANSREYLIEKRLREDSPLIGQNVASGGLRNLNGVYLVEIIREEETIRPVRPQEEIRKDDILIFAGNTDNIIDVTLSELGVRLPKNLTPEDEDQIRVVEAVISGNSGMIGKTVKNATFRERYDAAVVAIHRHGERLSGKIGNIRLKAGDVLLLYTGMDFRDRVELYKDLIVITGDDAAGKRKRPDSKYRIGATLVIAAVLLITQAFHLFTSLLIIFTFMVSVKLITIRNVKRDLDPAMIALLVLSITLGEAMIKSGGGELMAGYSVNFLKQMGPVWVLVGLMCLTTLLTSFVTNVGAVAIAFPIALAVSKTLEINGDPLFLGVAFAASAAFLTPIGYQTNLIVYGPGGYSFSDFFRIGLPVTLIYLTVATVMIVLLFGDSFA